MRPRQYAFASAAASASGRRSCSTAAWLLVRALGREADHDPRRAVLPVESSRATGLRGALAQHGAGQPALAQVGVHESLVETLDRHRHCLGGADREHAVTAATGRAQPARLLVVDRERLRPPAVDPVLARDPRGDLPVLASRGAPRVE